MIKFKLFNLYNKKIIIVMLLAIFALLIILLNFKQVVIKSYIDEVAKSSFLRSKLIGN